MNKDTNSYFLALGFYLCTGLCIPMKLHFLEDAMMDQDTLLRLCCSTNTVQFRKCLNFNPES